MAEGTDLKAATHGEERQKENPGEKGATGLRPLEKMGVPGHFLQVLKRYYTNREVAIATDGGEVKVGSTSGVMQGCRLSPTLFLFIMEALTELIEPRWKGKPIFHTNYQATGMRRLQVCSANSMNKGSTKDGFALWCLFYADDGTGMQGTRLEIQHMRELEPDRNSIRSPSHIPCKQDTRP